jgi:cell division protein FtsI/penicillin-binding protein 2
MIDSPTTNGHFGGTVAAPVFSKIMQYLVTYVNQK